jgi:hypothetical protein
VALIGKLMCLVDADRRCNGSCRPGAPSIKGTAAMQPGTPPLASSMLSATSPFGPFGYRKAKRLGGLEVHDHVKFCRVLAGQVS